MTVRETFIVSDIHLDGGDGAARDSARSARFEEFLRCLAQRKTPTKLIVLGDLLDYPRTLGTRSKLCPGESWRHGATEVESQQLTEHIVDKNRDIFDALGSLLAARHHVVIVPGNHDVDLFWPGVQEQLRVASGPSHSECLHFHGQWSLQERGLYLEHGHQWSNSNRFREFRPFIASTPPRLERCWGTLFMEAAYNGLERHAPWLGLVQHTWWAAVRAIREVGWGSIPVESAARMLAFLARYGLPAIVENLAPPQMTAPDVERTAAAVAASTAQPPSEVLSRADEMLREDANLPAPAATDALLGARGGWFPDRTWSEIRGHLDDPEIAAVVWGHTHAESDEMVECQPTAFPTHPWYVRACNFLRRRQLTTKRAINLGTWAGRLQFESLTHLLSTSSAQLLKLAGNPEHRYSYLRLPIGKAEPLAQVFPDDRP